MHKNRNRHRNRIHVAPTLATPTLATTFDDLIDPLTRLGLEHDAAKDRRRRELYRAGQIVVHNHYHGSAA